MSKNLFSIRKYRKLQRIAINAEEEFIFRIDDEMQIVVEFDIPSYEKVPHQYFFPIRRAHHAFARLFLVIAKMTSLKLHGTATIYIMWEDRPELDRVIYTYER